MDRDSGNLRPKKLMIGLIHYRIIDVIKLIIICSLLVRALYGNVDLYMYNTEPHTTL